MASVLSRPHCSTGWEPARLRPGPRGTRTARRPEPGPRGTRTARRPKSTSPSCRDTAMRQIHTASARAIDHGQASAAGVGRNAGQFPGFGRLDLRLTKVFDTARPFKNPNDKPGKLSLNVDLLNAFN